jgi:DNA-binding transcriptional MocR family regulator
LPVDPAGPTGDGLRAALAAGAVAVIITSRAQNPTGAVVRAARAQALRRIFREHKHVLVVEDDHAAELSVEPAHPLVGVTDTWTYIRSVSKPYGCDLRLAVLAGDELSVSRIEGRQRLGTGWVSTVLQRLVLRLWADPAVAEVVAVASAVYTARRTALREALGDVPSLGDSGLNVWIPVEDETAVVAGLREEGIVVVPGAYHRLVSPPAIRVTTASLPLSEAPRVADAIRRGVARTPRRSY